jgi:hypothetical protein
MKPGIEEARIQLQSRYKDLINQQTKALKITNPYQLDIEITKILEEKNKITIQLMNLK